MKDFGYGFTEKAKNCPVCESDDLDIVRNTNYGYGVVCLSCGRESVRTFVQAEAIILWNAEAKELHDDPLLKEIAELEEELREKNEVLEEIKNKISDIESDIYALKKKIEKQTA